MEPALLVGQASSVFMAAVSPSASCRTVEIPVRHALLQKNASMELVVSFQLLASAATLAALARLVSAALEGPVCHRLALAPEARLERHVHPVESA